MSDSNGGKRAPIAIAVIAFALACGDGGTDMASGPVQSGAGTGAGAGNEPMAGASAAAGNSGTGMPGMSATAGTGGMPGGMAGAGAAGTMAGASGSGAGMGMAGMGMAGMGAAGTMAGEGGMGAAGMGMAGMGQSGMGGSSDCCVRGPEPTAQSAMNKGPYNVESYTSGFRDGPAYADATIWYPTDAEPPFAGISIVPGFVSPQSSIAAWGPFLASHGIVAITIGTNTPADPPPTRKEALLDALETLKSENERQGSPLQGKMLPDRYATMGWSMGGGGTLLAANENPELKATVSLCGWNPGYRYSMNTVPALMFAGTADVLAGGQSQGFYESMPDTTPKLLFELAGGSHFYANDPAGANRQVGLYGLSWLKVFLEGDERYRQFLTQMPTGTSDFRVDLD